MKNKWLRGDNSANIQGRIMVLVHCPSYHCHLSINQDAHEKRMKMHIDVKAMSRGESERVLCGFKIKSRYNTFALTL